MPIFCGNTALSLHRREVSECRGARFSPPIGKLLLQTDFFTVEVATVRRLVTYYVPLSLSCLREKCTLLESLPGRTARS